MNNSIVKVPQDQAALTCTSNNGKPAAELKWFRNGEELTEGFVYTTVAPPENNKLENAKSVLTIEPKSEDNEAFFECRVQNGALKQPMVVKVQLSVMRK